MSIGVGGLVEWPAHAKVWLLQHKTKTHDEPQRLQRRNTHVQPPVLVDAAFATRRVTLCASPTAKITQGSTRSFVVQHTGCPGAKGNRLKTATKDQLLSLPGVTAGAADRVIAGRPYSEAGDVVTRHIMPKAEYDKIADRVTAKK